jgi:sterol desaturase/sphingolipid hydroxylase (fatty acid hydroxylase superfamily)
MTVEDVVGLLIPATWLVMLAIEALGTGRRWPALRFWRTRGVAFFMMLMTLNVALPALLPPQVTALHLLDGSRLGLGGGVVAGVLATTLVTALAHRAYHRFDFLWRWVHQLHHAPQRLDIVGGIVFTPQEIVLNIVYFQLVNVFVLGLTPATIALVGYVTVLLGLLPHFNVRTPRWLGVLFQRPESHSVHHRRGFHAYNYSDLPLWDMLFATFRNPQEFHGDVGFEGDAGEHLASLMLGRDANAALYGPQNRGRRDPAGNPA